VRLFQNSVTFEIGSSTVYFDRVSGQRVSDSVETGLTKEAIYFLI
jgi:hypothetical protein